MDHLTHAVSYAKQLGVPYLLVGCGSNLLFDDQGVAGVVVKIGNRISNLSRSGDIVTAEAGIWAPRLAHNLSKMGFSGLEHIVGIPGTLGGLIFMNGGSRRRNIGEAVQCVTVLSENGSVRRVHQDECHFGVRSSIFQETKEVILNIELKCQPGRPVESRRLMLDVLNSRRRKFPLSYPNCGSVFKSDRSIFDEHGPPGKIIEDCGLKGLERNGIRVSKMHANFFINIGGGTSRDFVDLVRIVRSKVYQRIGHYMECEIQYVSRGGEVSFLHEVL